MTPSQSSVVRLPQSDSRFAMHVERNMGFCTMPDLILDSPDLSKLTKLNRFVDLVIETASPPFFVRCRTCGKREGAVHESSDLCRETHNRNAIRNPSDVVAKKLTTFLPDLLPDMLRIFHPQETAVTRFRYAPRLQLLGSVFFSHRICFCYRGDGGNIGNADRIDSDVAEIYNDFVACFRQALMAKKLLRRECHNWESGSHENVKNMKAYLNKLFAGHDSLTVLHLRLSHAKREGPVTGPVEGARRDLNLLRQCRTQFFDRMRRKPALFTDAPEYVWSIVPVIDGSYELHLTLLFSSAAMRKVLDDKKMEAALTGETCEDYADQVGAYWVRIATSGRGSYRRGDQRDRLYDPAVWVHGQIHTCDMERRKRLEESLGYLARRRSLVRFENEAPGEYFGMRERKARRKRESVNDGARDAT